MAGGKIFWDFDATPEFRTTNGIKANGGSFSSTGPAIVDGMLYVNSGYGGQGLAVMSSLRQGRRWQSRSRIRAIPRQSQGGGAPAGRRLRELNRNGKNNELLKVLRRELKEARVVRKGIHLVPSRSVV